MELKELAVAFMKSVLNENEITKLYRYTTTRTIFFSIDEKKEVSMEECITRIKPYLEKEPKIYTSSVCVKFVYIKQEQEELHVYFEAKGGCFTRLEYSIKK